jgi:hypothetical protein
MATKTLKLSPLPCYEHWPAEQYHVWVREMIADIENEGDPAAARCQRPAEEAGHRWTPSLRST